MALFIPPMTVVTVAMHGVFVSSNSTSLAVRFHLQGLGLSQICLFQLWTEKHSWELLNIQCYWDNPQLKNENKPHQRYLWGWVLKGILNASQGCSSNVPLLRSSNVLVLLLHFSSPVSPYSFTLAFWIDLPIKWGAITSLSEPSLSLWYLSSTNS